MKTHRVGIIMNGVTGRMGTNQHLIRSISEIMKQGGVQIANREVIMPDPILVGRNEVKLKALAEEYGTGKYTTDLDSVLKDDNYSIYFDSQTTDRRSTAIRQAIEAGKHIYCEKPTATKLDEAIALAKLADAAGVKNGVVQDKLWLPGMLKLKFLIDTGFFGKILSVRGEFGYWVFDGKHQVCQRPSWNYRKEDGGGMVVDMLCHWRYLVDNLFGNITSLQCHTATHVEDRYDEEGNRYPVTADDSAYATFLTDQNIVCHFNSSWCTRVRRDDLLTVHVDGTKGSAVAGLRGCKVQGEAMTPKPVWNPDIEQPIDFFADWNDIPENQVYDNAFKIQWELFLKHVVQGDDFRWGLLEGAKGMQLAELGLESHAKRKWIDVGNITA